MGGVCTLQAAGAAASECMALTSWQCQDMQVTETNTQAEAPPQRLHVTQACTFILKACSCMRYGMNAASRQCWVSGELAKWAKQPSRMLGLRHKFMLATKNWQIMPQHSPGPTGAAAIRK